MKIFSSLPLAALLCAAVSIAAFSLFSGRIALFAAQKTPPAKDADGPKEKSAAQKKQEADAAAKKAAEQQKRMAADQRRANALLRRSLATLQGVTYSAHIREDVHIQDRRFNAEGEYLQGKGEKLRLELAMKLDRGKNAVSARLLQVCDGEVLYTRQQVGDRVDYSRRNVKQILEYAQSLSPRVPRADLVAQLGIGGIRGLLASLQLRMAFYKYEQITVGSREGVMIEGTWNNATLKVWRQPDGSMDFPAHLPRAVRVYVDADYYLRRIEFLQQDPLSGGLVALVTIQFDNIKVNPTIPEEKFRFQIPSRVFPNNRTKLYIERLRAAAGGGEGR